MAKFLGGFLTGAVALLLFEVVAAVLLYQFLVKPMVADMMDMNDGAPPPLPTGNDMLLAGTINAMDLDEQSVEIPIGDGTVLVVNRWATWCPPCVAEMPSLVALAEQTKDRGVRVVCVSDESVNTLQKWHKGNDYSVPIYSLLSMPMDMGNKGIPETWVIGPTGKIEFMHTGMANWAHPSVLEYLDSLSVSADTETIEIEGDTFPPVSGEPHLEPEETEEGGERREEGLQEIS